MTKYRIICGQYREYIIAENKRKALEQFTVIYGDIEGLMLIEEVEE